MLELTPEENRILQEARERGILVVPDPRRVIGQWNNWCKKTDQVSLVVILGVRRGRIEADGHVCRKGSAEDIMRRVRQIAEHRRQRQAQKNIAERGGGEAERKT